MMTSLKGVCLGMLLAGLTACTGAVIGGAAEGGYDDTRPQLAADARLVARIQSRLLNDEVVGRYDIEVTCRNAVVTLRGRVPSAYIARRAEGIAREVGGVAEVRSELNVTR